MAGFGEVKTMPDVATITYTLRGEGATSDEAVREMVSAGNRIEAALYRLDTAAEPKTDDVRVKPVKASTCKDRDYDSDDQLSKGACAIVGYIATQVVTIRTNKTMDAGTMVGLLGRGGAYNARITGFELSDPRPAKTQAIAIALADAQSKAAAVAAGSRVNLGPILTVSMVGPLDVLSSQEVKLAGTVRRADLVNSLPQSFATPVTVTLTPEPISTAATITVTYAIN